MANNDKQTSGDLYQVIKKLSELQISKRDCEQNNWERYHEILSLLKIYQVQLATIAQCLVWFREKSSKIAAIAIAFIIFFILKDIFHSVF